MFLLPPRSHETNISKYKSDKAVLGFSGKEVADIRERVRAYNKVVRRDNRQCSSCGKEPLHAPHLRIGVLDPEKSVADADNLVLLCVKCCKARETAIKRDGLTAADQTGLTHQQKWAIERDGRRCGYCLRGPLYGIHADVVVSNPSLNKLDPSRYGCACKTCKNERGSLSHAEYVERCAENAADLAAYLKDLHRQLAD